MNTQNNFPKQISKLEITKLNQAGFNNLYNFITYFPFRLQQIQPFTRNSNDSSISYLINATISNVEFRKVGKGYFLISLISELGIRLEGYLFQNHNYIWSELKLGLTFQWIVQVSAKGFLNIQKWSHFKGFSTNPFFKLGSAQMQNWLLPVYLKSGVLTTSKFNLIHQKLNFSEYNLDLTSLAPANNFFPLKFSLEQIHKPSSLENYNKSKQNWIAFQLFLKMSTYKQIKENNQILLAKSADISLENLKLMSSSIPFNLTQSQKTTIWDILNQIGTVR